MDHSIVAADEARMAEIEEWLDEEEARYSTANEEWKANDYDGQNPVRGFRCNWDSVKKGWKSGRKVFALIVQDHAVGFLDGTDILEIRPNWRGKGLGAVLADFMLKQEFDAGRSVVDIGIAPFSSEPFWRERMGFTVMQDREWYGGGTYAYKVLTRTFELSAGDRVPYTVEFYSEEDGYSKNSVPFARFSGLGERKDDGSIQLPERAYCFNENDEQHTDYFVAITLDGTTLVFDKAKRDECAELGVQKDKGGVYFLDRIRPAR
jgi:GNAT superfamily N-acetyltransferase